MNGTLADLIFKKCSTYGHLEALSISGRSISYEELSKKALIVANLLIKCGAKNETVGIVGQRSADAYFGILGTLYAGCNYTPINPKYSKARIGTILRDAGIRFLVGHAADLEAIEPLLLSCDLPPISAILLPEGRAPLGKNWIDETVGANDAPINKPVEINITDLAYLLYTSGSTGAPKGVQVSHSNILAFLRSMSSIYKLEPGFRASQTFDLSFDPSVSDMFFTWANGGVLCVLPESELILPFDYIRREKITFWNSVPTIASLMAKMGYLTPGCFPDLQYSMFCGEQFPKHVADMWRQAAPQSTIENLYGPTEATIYISRHAYTRDEVNQSFRNSIIPIGQPFIDHACALIDENGKCVANGEVGEIVFSGPQVTRGYLHDQTKTDDVFVRFDWDDSGAIWYRTGDLGFYNPNGNLECIGRRDSQIKLAGRRIEIGEIEATLARYPQLRDAVVVPLRDKNQVVTGCVAFTMNALTKQDELYIRQDGVQYLEQIFFPKKIITIEEFPRAPSGKINRKLLTDLAEQVLTNMRKDKI